MGKIPFDKTILVIAVLLFAASLFIRPSSPEPEPFVSFNDGTIECVNIYIQPNMSREAQSDLLRSGAEQLLETGCVNFSFEGEN